MQHPQLRIVGERLRARHRPRLRHRLEVVAQQRLRQPPEWQRPAELEEIDHEWIGIGRKTGEPLRPELFAVLSQRRQRQCAQHQSQIARPVRARRARAGDNGQQNAGQQEIRKDDEAAIEQIRKVVDVLRRVGPGGGRPDGEIHQPKADMSPPARPGRMLKQAPAHARIWHWLRSIPHGANLPNLRPLVRSRTAAPAPLRRNLPSLRRGRGSLCRNPLKSEAYGHQKAPRTLLPNTARANASGGEHIIERSPLARLRTRL